MESGEVIYSNIKGEQIVPGLDNETRVQEEKSTDR